ncbi:cupin domain-containing protein [Devosia sp.]|uniref:cupin domain-containing protein n=1 Tax=Devosia sp. TaxID=1871048 RepID=UPI002FC5B91C
MKAVVHTDHAFEEWREGVRTRMLVSARAGASQLCIFEQWVAPGAGAPTHHHPVEEVLTVMAGDVEFWLDGTSLLMATGQSLIVPALQKHGFANVGTTELHMHAVLASPLQSTGQTILRWAD